MIFFESMFLTALIMMAVSTALSYASMLIFQRQPPTPQIQQQNMPPPPNGVFNERQSVPPRRAGFGRCRTGGDYMTLEEKAGVAYHQLAHCSHRIKGFVQHWLHDELITLDEHGVITAPTHFAGKVKIETRLGDNAEVAWQALVTALPAYWTVDHRGDGISQVRMAVTSVDIQSQATVFPQGMPQHTSLDDLAFLYDPRNATHDMNDELTWEFSRNLALGLMFFVTHPSGYKRSLDELIMEDWIAAANNCDEIVLDRDGIEQNRYWGGLTWKHRSSGDDPVSIGRKIAEAGDMVLYTNGDGKIGVHPGKMVLPTIRLTEDDITELRYDANKAESTTVLAVRGRFIDPRNNWLTSDSAIFGDPYAAGDDNTQRTTTVDNEAVQNHNHIQRLQKLKFIRANAPRISIRVMYSDRVADLMFHRFVRVHVPSRGLDEAIIEIVNGAKLDLSVNNFSIQVDGILVSENLYDFDAATEEGIPGGVVGPIEATGVPVPTGFTIQFKSESLASGATFAYIVGTWTHFDDTFTHEMQYQPQTGTQAPRSVSSNPTEDTVRTPSLEAGVKFKVRLRAWSAGAPSPWTDYLLTDIDGGGDNIEPPADPYSLTVTYGSGGTDTNSLDIYWNNPASDNLDNTVVYISAAGFDTATVMYTDRSGPSTAVTFTTSTSGWPFPATAVYNVWVRSFNSAAVGSNLVGPVASPTPPP